MTTIRMCSCEHKFQDATYGSKRRVFNKMKDFEKDKKARCTVCERETVK
jgi:hypothetical protein